MSASIWAATSSLSRSTRTSTAPTIARAKNKRLMELFVDGGRRPMTMIRFNPDSYVHHGGSKVGSCWTYSDKRGMCRVGKTRRKEWQSRLQTLRTTLERACSAEMEREIEVIHLFYDGWSL
jgi:hypothetical protein